MRVQGLRFAPVGPKPRSTGPRGPRCLLLSRFSSAGRASALQAEGPRFDPWNRDDGSFPIRLGESTPLTRRPKGKRLVPFFGKCGHGVIGSIPVFQTEGAGSAPVVHSFTNICFGPFTYVWLKHRPVTAEQRDRSSLRSGSRLPARSAKRCPLGTSTGPKPRSTGSRASLRDYIPLYQNGIWIRLRTGGLRVRIPPGALTRS